MSLLRLPVPPLRPNLILPREEAAALRSPRVPIDSGLGLLRGFDGWRCAVCLASFGVLYEAVGRLLVLVTSPPVSGGFVVVALDAFEDFIKTCVPFDGTAISGAMLALVLVPQFLYPAVRDGDRGPPFQCPARVVGRRCVARAGDFALQRPI